MIPWWHAAERRLYRCNVCVSTRGDRSSGTGALQHRFSQINGTDLHREQYNRAKRPIIISLPAPGTRPGLSAAATALGANLCL